MDFGVVAVVRNHGEQLDPGHHYARAASQFQRNGKADDRYRCAHRFSIARRRSDEQHARHRRLHLVQRHSVGKHRLIARRNLFRDRALSRRLTYAASDSAPVSVTVNKENSQTQAFLVTFDYNGNIISRNTTTAAYGSPYILRVNVENAAGQTCAPVAASGATACPSGNVTVSNNGSALDAGTYALNTFGYLEDLIVQLPGGTDSVKAAYAGDNSFNASTLTNAITITPASTSMLQPSIFGEAVGQSANMSTFVNTTSSGAAPTGTVTFYANGTALTGTTAYSPRGGGQGYSASLQVTLTSNTNAFTTPGNYSITATYSGDANYSSANAPAQNIAVKYPTPNLVLTPFSQTVNYGGTASITVLVDTTNQSMYPTGTVTFNGISAAPVACTNVKDTSGNFACQAIGMFTVTSSGSIQVQYSGDSNYPASYSSAYINMPDFTFGASGWVQLTAGHAELDRHLQQLQWTQRNYLQHRLFRFARRNDLHLQSGSSYSPE